jgi:single-strand selective monofunctional uracil DNA glycosylase
MAATDPIPQLRRIVAELVRALAGIEPAPPVSHVYNPLEYAGGATRQYLERYARPAVTNPGRALLVGMNPGPWGMAQTGVPFGAVGRVRDWLGIEAPVGRPDPEHPKKPVDGFACAREEVSGDRLWGWAQETWGTPERFFASFFVWNHCPLLFLEPSGRNLTPDKLPAEARRRVLDPCDAALRAVVECLGFERVVGVGGFAEQRARVALEGRPVRVDRVLHPSPASPAANRGWAEQATAQLRELGMAIPG